MARVLIPTCLHDTHATAVSIALRKKGHEAVPWHGADFPTSQQASISISDESGLCWDISGPALYLSDTHFDVIWDRRPTPPFLPDDLHSGDRYIAMRACNAFIGALRQMIAPDAFWVNPLGSGGRANAKPLQLIEALRVGMKIPPTLCSNDPQKIRSFLAKHSGQTVYKTYRPAAWKSDTGVALTFTSAVTTEHLPDDDVLRLSPGIFQKEIQKAYELRINYMGNFSTGAKMLSQGDPKTRLDWRMAQDDLKIEKAPPLPADVDRACRELMRRLGIIFGCFDLIVTPQGEYVFLEVNEMGQFLWIEEMNPDILLLDPFCEFLVQGSVDFRWKPKKESLRFLDLRDEVAREDDRDSHTHKERRLGHLADDYGQNPSGAVASLE